MVTKVTGRSRQSYTSIEDLLLHGEALDDESVEVLGYHSGTDIGGGQFYYDASRAKSDHNGGTVLSTTVPWSNTANDYLNGVGETDPSGTGCWIRRDTSELKYVFPTISLMQSSLQLKAGYRVATSDNDLVRHWQITTTPTSIPIGITGNLYAFELKNYDTENLKKVLERDLKLLSSINSFRGVNTGSENFQKARVVNILGDSISFGAGADTSLGGIEMNAWARIFGKMARAEWGGNQYGFATAVTNNGTGTEIHNIALGGGTWTSRDGADGGHLPNGWAQLSPSVGASQNVTVKSKYKYMRVWYDDTIVGGFDVSVDGVVVDSISVTGTGTGLAYTDAYTLLDDGTGSSNFGVTVTSGQIGICGYEYLDVKNGLNTPEFRVQNFSRDGRKGQFVSQNVINKMAEGCHILVWALGANDRTASGSDLDDFNQRMDWLRDACIANSTKLVVLDMLYVNPDSNGVRLALRRVVDETPQARLIPFANLFTTSGNPPVSGYLIDDLNWSYDGVHPTYIGHRTIAESLAQVVGLNTTSKYGAELADSSWNPVTLSAGVTNGITDPHRISRYRFNNNTLEIFLNTSNIPAPNTIFGNINLMGREVKDLRQYYTLPDGSGNTALISVASNGDLRYIVDPASPGAVTSINAMIVVPTSSVSNFLTYN